MPARWSVETAEPPEVEPVDLATVKSHVRINEGYTDDDALLALYIGAARSWAEAFTNRSFITRSLVLWYDTFAPATGWPATLWIPYGPVQEITKFTYYDPAGVATELTVGTSDDGVVDVVLDNAAHAPRVVPRYNIPWPVPKIFIRQVKIEYDAGYGDAPEDVPPDIRAAILLVVGHLYEHRENIVIGAAPSRVPLAAESLLGNYRDFSIYTGD